MPSATQQSIYVAGHLGMVGSAVVRRLQKEGGANINININIITRTRHELDLLDQASVTAFFQQTPIDQVYLAEYAVPPGLWVYWTNC